MDLLTAAGGTGVLAGACLGVQQSKLAQHRLCLIALLW